MHSAVFGPVKMDRLDAYVNDAFINRVHRHCANISFEHPLPGFSRVIGAIEAVLGDTKINDLGVLPRPVDGIDGSVLKANRNLLPGAVFCPTDEEAFLSPRINSNRSSHSQCSFQRSGMME